MLIAKNEYTRHASYSLKPNSHVEGVRRQRKEKEVEKKERQKEKYAYRRITENSF